jgi:hypothetical protein
MNERAANTAGTSSRHDGTAAEKLDLLEKRRIARSPLHDRPARARTHLRGDNVNLITKQECDDFQLSLRVVAVTVSIVGFTRVPPTEKRGLERSARRLSVLSDARNLITMSASSGR